MYTEGVKEVPTKKATESARKTPGKKGLGLQQNIPGVFTLLKYVVHNRGYLWMSETQGLSLRKGTAALIK